MHNVVPFVGKITEIQCKTDTHHLVVFDKIRFEDSQKKFRDELSAKSKIMLSQYCIRSNIVL